MSRKIRLNVEIVHARLLRDEALPALEAAIERRSGTHLVRVAKSALSRLQTAKPPGTAHEPDVIAWRLAVARLEAVLATAPDPPATAGAIEEVAWALLRASRAAAPVSLGEDWDLLRVLVDPARRRTEGLAQLGTTLAGAALAGAGLLATPTGFSLARERSYATGWNAPERVGRIERSLLRFTPARLEAAARATPPDIARSVWPRRTSPLAKRVPRARAALEKLQAAYALAAREAAGTFIELELD